MVENRKAVSEVDLEASIGDGTDTIVFLEQMTIWKANFEFGRPEEGTS